MMCFDVPHLNMNAAPVTVQYAFVWKGAVWTFSKEKRKLYGLKQSQIPSKFFIFEINYAILKTPLILHCCSLHGGKQLYSSRVKDFILK